MIISYFYHYNLIYLLLQLPNSFLQRQNVGVEDWFPQRPHFLQLCQLLYFLGTPLPHSLGIRLHLGIQYLLMATVGSTIGFSISVVSTAHLFHTTLAVPAADHGTEHVPAFLTGQQPRVTVLGLIAVCRAALLFE